MKRVESKVRFEPEFYARLQHAMIDRGRKSLQGLIEECLERWIEEGDSAHGKAPWTSATVREAGDTPSQDQGPTRTIAIRANSNLGDNPITELRDALLTANATLRAIAARAFGIIDKGGSTDFVGANINDARSMPGDPTTEELLEAVPRELSQARQLEERLRADRSLDEPSGRTDKEERATKKKRA